jgi:ribonuclease HII
VEEIDQLNILQASLLAMQRAVAALPFALEHALVDGNHAPNLNCPVTTIIKGDLSELAIAAASILAKVARDREILVLDQLYPGYGLAKHKGYPTAQHQQALLELGPSPIHRRSFAPVRRAIR